MTLSSINLVLVAIKILHGFKPQIYASITELGSWLTNSRIPLIPRIPIDGIASVMDRNRRLGPNHGSRSTGGLGIHRIRLLGTLLLVHHVQWFSFTCQRCFE